MGRLVFLLTSARVASGLLSSSAWQALRSADRVLCGDPDMPLRQVLSAEGVPVEVVGGGDAERAAAALGAAAGAEVVWLAGVDGDPAMRAKLTAELAGRAETGSDGPEVEVLTGSYDLPGARLVDLVRVMDRLRASCPWDRQQTHRSLVRYLVEETYETLEAVESGDSEHLREELGDLLLQVVFHARIAEEDADAPWTIDDVAAGLVDKLVRRHPHVFAGAAATDAAAVEVSWERLKAAEKRRSSALDGVPLALPALTLAAKVRQRAKRASIEVTAPAACDAADIGAALFSLVAAAQDMGIDAEQALRDEVRRFTARVRAAESAAATGRSYEG